MQLNGQSMGKSITVIILFKLQNDTVFVLYNEMSLTRFLITVIVLICSGTSYSSMTEYSHLFGYITSSLFSSLHCTCMCCKELGNWVDVCV